MAEVSSLIEVRVPAPDEEGQPPSLPGIRGESSLLAPLDSCCQPAPGARGELD